MRNGLAKRLANLHGEYGVYDREKLCVPPRENIIDQIPGIGELAYLHRFYINYRRNLLVKLKKRRGRPAISRMTHVSRSVDLPFIGEAVVDRAKYFFVFEGSLSMESKLSVTVLSCLWPLEGMASLMPLQNIFRNFWPSPYDFIVESLKINAEIARHSYVVDAVRIGKQDGKGKQDLPTNRELLSREICLLNPALVILVGRTAANIVGKEAQRTQKNRYCQVPFPTKRRSKRDAKRAERKYEKLREQMWVA